MMTPVKDTVKDLRFARRLIEKETAWTKGAFARDVHDIKVLSQSESACKFCAVGALERAVFLSGEKVFFNDRYSEAVNALYAVLPQPTGFIAQYNDSGSHEEVLKLYDLAITKLEASLNV